MAPRRRRLPSFYVILLDRSAPHLTLPANFVSKHLENKIPDDPILLSDNGGHSWKLKIKKDGEIYCFADEWKNVVEDSLLEFGDFLLFCLVDESTFKLSVFSPSGCEKMFPPKIQDEEVDHDVDEVAETREEVEEEVEDNDDEDENEEEEEEEEEDEDEETDEEEEEEEEKEDIYDDDGGEEEEDGEEDDDGGGDIDGNDGDPFFMAKITNCHGRGSMRLPMGFVRLAGLDGERSIKIKNLDGEEWLISLLSESRHHYSRYYLSAGWLKFKRLNQLCEGDKCVFKFLRSEDKLCLAKVTKKRIQGKQPPVKVPATESKYKSAEVLRRTRRQPPRVEVVEKKGRGKRGPVVEVSERRRGKRRCVEVESKDERREVVKRKTRAEKVPEGLRRLRNRPPRVVVEETVRSKKPAGKTPVAEGLKRKRGRPSRVVESEKDGAKAVRRGRSSRVEVEGKNDGEKVVKRRRGRPFKKKKPYTCRVCGKGGHNFTTCTSQNKLSA